MTPCACQFPRANPQSEVHQQRSKEIPNSGSQRASVSGESVLLDDVPWSWSSCELDCLMLTWTQRSTTCLHKISTPCPRPIREIITIDTNAGPQLCHTLPLWATVQWDGGHVFNFRRTVWDFCCNKPTFSRQFIISGMGISALITPPTPKRTMIFKASSSWSIPVNLQGPSPIYFSRSL